MALRALTIGLVATVVIALVLTAQVSHEGSVLKTETKLGLQHDLESRIAIYSEPLAGLQGLFGAVDEVSRQQFADYADAAATFAHFPRIQAVTFTSLVPREELAVFEAAVREDTSLKPLGYPDFVVQTRGDTGDLYIVNYLNPVAGNEASFGLDVGSDPTHRAAIEEARDSGQVVGTGPVTLGREKGEQRAVLLYAPFYNGPSGSLADRRANFQGVFSANLRMNDFLSGASSRDDIRFTIFDVETSLTSDDSAAGYLFGTWTSDFEDSTERFQIDVGQRTWQVALDPSSIPTNEIGRWFVLVGIIASASPLVLASYFSYRERQRLVTQAGELQVANDAIRTSNADLERFAHVAAHDLRAPIRGIRNLVDLLDDELGEIESEDNVSSIMRHLSTSASRMDAMVRGLLEFSMIGGPSQDSWSDVDMTTKFEQAIAELRETTGSEPVVNLEQLPMARGNPVLIERLLANLFTNANKYRSDERPLEITIGHREHKDHIEYSVGDNGIGIAEEFHEQIFDIFRRLHGPDQIEGRGIGLSLCRKIVEHHGGEIRLESAEGQGTTFIFTLPKQLVDKEASAHLDGVTLGNGGA